MPRYNHAFDVAFTVISNKEDASDVTPAMLSAALRKRADDLDATPESHEWLEACDCWDTYEEVV